MTEKLDIAISQARLLPEEEQDAIADMLMQEMHASGVSVLTEAQHFEVAQRMREPYKITSTGEVETRLATLLHE